MKIRDNIINYWKPTLVSLFILYGSITSEENLNKISLLNFPYMDKVIHMLLYFILSLTILASLIRSGKQKKHNHMLITFVWVISYGMLMEVFQFYLTQTRSAEILDILANTTGCIFAFLLYSYIKKTRWQKIL
ncbi:MAG: VanZ family protein [Bacteroidales bacterium]